MSNTNLQFVGDLQSAINSYSETGTVIYTSEANMYVIKSDSSKLKISDIMFVSILPTIGITNKLYVLTTTFTLNFYDTIWHEIKPSELAIKADKVTPVVENNLLSMDSIGNLKDSGNKVSDFETPTGSQTKVDNSIIAIKNGVSTDGDTLLKLRGLITGIQTLLSVNDINFDTLQEVVTAIKSDEGLLTSLTINKINTSDIIDDLLHIDVNKPLSANQGLILKGLLDTSIGGATKPYEIGNYGILYDYNGEGKIITETITGSITRTTTFTYNTGGSDIGKILNQTIVEEGKTITMTYSYTLGKISGVVVTTV